MNERIPLGIQWLVAFAVVQAVAVIGLLLLYILFPVTR